MRLRYCTVNALEQLKSAVPERLDWYFDPIYPLTSLPPGGYRESAIEAPELASKLAIVTERPSETDVTNALTVFSSLQNLTPHQAAFQRLWVYLCHFDCPQYVSARWLNRRPNSKERAARQVRNHFFVTGNRGLIRDNGLARLWWLGKIAHDVDPVQPDQFLELLLHRQDVRSALIERPSVSMNHVVLQKIYIVMKEHWKNGKALFVRDTFRSWMKSLNRRGGVVLLDALPEDDLISLLREEANQSIAHTSIKLILHGR